MQRLVSLFFDNFVDIAKILQHFDNEKSKEFKKKNAFFRQKQGLDSESCCSKVQNTFYYGEKEMTFLEREVKQQVSIGSLRYYLKDLLKQVQVSYEKIKQNGISQGLEFDDEVQKELLQRCAYETVNQFLIGKVRQSLVEKEQNYSKSVGLLAHVRSLKQIFTQNLLDKSDDKQLTVEQEESIDSIVQDATNQISPEQLKTLLQKNYVEVHPFIQDKDSFELLQDLTRQLTMMELEGRFMLQRTNMPVEMKPRNDKVLSLQLSEIKNYEQLRLITRVLEKLSYLPYELNAKNQAMQLQISEQADISYFSSDHSFVNMHQDSSLIAGQDTGIKITALFIVNKEIGGDFTLTLQLEKGKRTIHGKSNLLVLLKSRVVGYEIKSSIGKVFVFSAKISGPNDQTM